MYENAEYHVRCRKNLVNESGGLDKLSTLKNWFFFYTKQKNMNPLAFFMNPSHLSGKIIS